MRSAIEPRARAIARYDRLFYGGIAISMALVVFMGFGPTYFLRAFDQAPMATLSGGPMTPLMHVHAVLFTGWVLFFAVQTTLVARHKVAIHRRLGIAGAVLAALMVLVGVLAALNSAARGAAPGGGDRLSFLMIPLIDVGLFGAFVVTALYLRANREAHKRMMLLAYVSIVAAAVARLPGMLQLGPFAFFGASFLFVLAGILYDLATRRRVHPVYLWGGGLLVISVPLRLAVSQTDSWRRVAELLVSLV